MTRRAAPGRAAWLAGAAAIMPIAALGIPLLPAAAAPAGQFQAPAAPMVLTRILRRPLPGGAEVTTRRSYEIRFTPDGDGYRIDGRLLAAEIEAPPPYQALAAIERGRPDDGMFPLRLDAAGKLMPVSEPGPSSSDRDASSAAMERIGLFDLPAEERRQAKAFVGVLETRPGRTAWPVDLFRPEPGRHQQTRTIPLPNGARGNVSVDIEARTNGPAGLLASLDRTVTTEIDGDARVAHESWTLIEAR